jgi:hypothetical protein
MLKCLLLALALLALAPLAHAQSTWPTPTQPTGGPSVGGVVEMYLNSSGQAVPTSNVDPCLVSASSKSSVAVNITSATTTALVAAVTGKSVYVCGGVLTIAPSATAADTATLEYGTGATCGSGTTALTGAFGAGDLTSAAPPIVVPLFTSGVILATPISNALCLLSAGTAVSIQGVVSYVQQ